MMVMGPEPEKMAAPPLPANLGGVDLGLLATPRQRILAYWIDWGVFIAVVILGGLLIKAGDWIGHLSIFNFLAADSDTISFGNESLLGKFIKVGLEVGFLPFFLCYFFYLPVHPNHFTGRGQTIGAKIMGIKVISTDGTEIGLGKYFIRFLTAFYLSSFFLLGYIWILINPRRQGWHDSIASTYVIKVR